MLTRQEIEEWHDPPCGEQAEWLLKLADTVIGLNTGKEEIGPSCLHRICHQRIFSGTGLKNVSRSLTKSMTQKSR